MHAPDRHGGGFGGAGGLSLHSDELSRLGKGPSGGDGAVPGTLISIGDEEGERCRAGSSLWGWHGGDCAWARGRGVWRQGGAWVWQWAGTGQEVALNSCHNGRALGCGGSEPRPKRQRRWHGGGRRQVRM